MNSQHSHLELKSSYGLDQNLISTQKYIPLKNSLSGLALKSGEVQMSMDFSSDNRISSEIKQCLHKRNIHSTIIPLKYQDQYLGSINLVYNEFEEKARQGFADSILDSLRKPYTINDMILEIDISMCVAVYPMDGKDSHALLRSDDVAMYEAKRKGGGVVDMIAPLISTHQKDYR